MKTIFPFLVESGYQSLARYTSYTAWMHFRKRLERERMELSELEVFRLQRLRQLLRHAYENIPFYRDLWNTSGVDPLKINSFEELRKLPVVTKEDLIRGHQNDAFSLSRRSDFEMTHTSGTTGPPLYLPFTRDDLQLKYASYLREFYATGWRLGVPSAALHYSGHPEFGGEYTGHPDRDNFVWIRKLAFRIGHRRRLLQPWTYNNYDENDDLPGQWYHVLRRHRPYLLESMDFNLLALYRYIRAHDLPPLKIPVMFVLATLAPELKQRLESFFSTQIFNRFGPHEIEGVAYECDHHEGLHVAADCVHVEILDDRHQPVPNGVSGQVVLTDFDSRVMPLIRYQIGDIGRRLDQTCSCGRVFPLMAHIEGRSRDRFQHVDGRTISATKLVSALQALPDLDLFQVIQDEQNRVEFRLPPADSDRLAALEPAVMTSIRTTLGQSVDIRVTSAKPLCLEPSGKFCFAKRENLTF